MCFGGGGVLENCTHEITSIILDGNRATIKVGGVLIVCGGGYANMIHRRPGVIGFVHAGIS